MGATDRDIARAKDFIAPPGYSRHRPEATLLCELVAEHYPAFRDRRAAEGRSLPRYVEAEFEAYLRCGLPEHGFLRVKCDACQAEKLVAFSCKCRGFCPSCGARRMAETAALLVDSVLPRQPVRQWVLSLPFALRYLLATRPEVTTQVLGIVYALKTPYRDGTTLVIFEPEDFIARLVALVPKPRAHLTRYHGVFATPLFTRLLDDYLLDESYRKLQRALMENPEMGDLMPGTGGFRKIRWRDARRGKGKRGGLRAIYYYLSADHQIWFFTLYGKDEAADLTAEEKKILKKSIQAESEARRRGV